MTNFVASTLLREAGEGDACVKGREMGRVGEGSWTEEREGRDRT